VQSAEEILLALLPDERGRVISVLRSARGMTRDELAKQAKVSPNTITEWEKGKVQNPRAMYRKLHPVLNMSPANLRHALGIVHHPPPEGAAAEVRERAAEYEPAASSESDASEVAEMSSPEIDGEISDLYAEVGRLQTRIHLLQTELAVRHGILRCRP
jgi:transcriptional regulator with XRE-family HTH domain